MKKFKLLPLVLIILLSVSLLPVSALAADEPDIGAQAAIVVNAETGDVYYEKNADRTIQPASTTKLMTALLVAEALERGDIYLSDSITAGETCLYNLEADSTDASPRLTPGESMSVEDLMYCMMLVSANEASNLLAQYVGGTIDDFVARMNDRAQELGCTGTHFANANGLEQEGHYSTARDFSLIAQEAMRHSLVQEVAGTLRRTVPETNVAGPRELVNTNALLNQDSEFYYEYAYGIKTGFFTNAGYCLVSAAERDNIDLICVVMGGPAMDDQFRDTLTLYRWAFDTYEYRQILSSAEPVVTVPVELGTSDSVGVRAEDAVSVILPKDYDVSRIGYQYVLYHEAEGDALEAPINAGETLGEITVVELDENNNAVRTFGSSRLVAASGVEMSRSDYIRSQIGNLFQEPIVRRIITILIVLLVVYLLLVVFYYIQRVRHLSSVRQAKKERAERQADEESQWLNIPEVRDEEPGIDYFGESESAPALKAPSRKAEKSQRAAPPAEDALPDVDLGEKRYSGSDFGAEDLWHKPGRGKADTPKKAAEKPEPSSSGRRAVKDQFDDDDFFDSFFKS